jgi:hypothetical protein
MSSVPGSLIGSNWEYHIEALPTASDEDLTDLLDELGKKGWRLIWLEPRDVDAMRGYFIREV